jgi:hypothetical protein
LHSSSVRTDGEPRPGPSRRIFAGVLVALVILISLMLTIRASVRAERARQPELSSLRPAVSLAAGAGRALAARSRAVAELAGWVSAAVLAAAALFGLVRRKKEGLAPALALLACALGALGEARLVLGHFQPGVGLYLAALLLFCASLVLSRKDSASEDAGARISPWVAATVLVVLAWAGLLYRFYALGQFPPDFDGEETFYMACSTTLYGAAQVTFGTEGPWSPLGWLYYLLVFFFTRTCGTTLLSIRFVSAVSGFLAIPLFFGFLRRLAGTLEAVLGTIFLCFGLTEILWSRTDDYPLHAPGVLAIALAWASYEAITTERFRFFVVAAVLMALSYHQYPSGQTSFLIPVGAVFGRSLFARGFLRRSWKGVLVVFLGVALWAAGLGINGLLAGAPFQWRDPFALNPGKTLWSVPLEHPGPGARARFLAESALKGVGVIARTQFVEAVPSDFQHHENVPPFGDLPVRHTSAPVAVLLALGFAALLLRPVRPASLVLLSWLVAGSLPGLLSTFPSSRRMATLFPAYMAVAALTGGLVLRSAVKVLGKTGGRILVAATLLTAFAGLGAVAGFLYLGSATSTPRAVRAADAIRPYLKPGTLAVFEAEYYEYTVTQLTYLLLDTLNAGPRPAQWRIAQFADWPTIAFRPNPNPASWVYRLTMLRGRAAALAKDPGFDRVTFLVQNTDARKWHRHLLTQLYPGQAFEQLHVSSKDDGRFNFVAMTVDSESLKDNQCPVVTLPAGARPAAGPADWWEGMEVRIRRDGRPSAPVTVSAGFWVGELSRSSLRIRGAGDGASLLLDGMPHPKGESRLLTRGIHRIDLTLGSSSKLPLRLEAAFDGPDFRPVGPEGITAPHLAVLPLLAAETVSFYPGFDVAAPVVGVNPDFLSDLAVAPDGSIVVARGFREELKLELYPPQKGPSTVWSQPRPSGGRPPLVSVSFIGDRAVALLSWPHLSIYDRQGKLQREIDLTGMMDSAEGLAANEAGEIFVLSASGHGVFALSPEGRVTGLLQPKDPGNWVPESVSAAYRGPVAVLDSENHIRVFEKTASGWEQTRVQPGQHVVDPNHCAMRADGWLFSQDANTHEFVVFDRELGHRVTAEPLHDPSRFPPPSRFLGFDREGRLYTATSGRVTCLVPVGDRPASAAQK